MALSIKDPETERLARAPAEHTGRTIALATRRARKERLRRMGSEPGKTALSEYRGDDFSQTDIGAACGA